MIRPDDFPGGQAPYLIRGARVPACMLAGSGWQVVDAIASVDILVAGARIEWIRPAGVSPVVEGVVTHVNLDGLQLWATLVDMHTHLDKGQVMHRVSADGTIHGGSLRTEEDYTRWTEEDIFRRMDFGLRCAWHHGVSVVRTHLDSFAHLAPRSWKVFDRLRTQWRGRIELQAVSIVPLGCLDEPWGRELAAMTADFGGVLGGVTDALGRHDGGADERLRQLLPRFFQIAKQHSLDVDLHVDQLQDRDMFSLPMIARAVLESGFAGTVVAGHCVNLALQDDDVVAQTASSCAAAGIKVVTLPTPMMYLQDRAPGRTPRWRGVTAAKELLAAGVDVAIAGDNCRDAWYPFGDHDMFDTFQRAVQVFQLDDPLEQAVRMCGPTPASTVKSSLGGLLRPGGQADFIVFPARNFNELMCRPHSNRLVVRAGVPVRDPLPDYAELD